MGDEVIGSLRCGKNLVLLNDRRPHLEDHISGIDANALLLAGTSIDTRCIKSRDILVARVNLIRHGYIGTSNVVPADRINITDEAYFSFRPGRIAPSKVVFGQDFIEVASSLLKVVMQLSQCGRFFSIITAYWDNPNIDPNLPRGASFWREYNFIWRPNYSPPFISTMEQVNLDYPETSEFRDKDRRVLLLA